ncbi:hypothetical protein H6P81_020461 [Aristolochia fimbriata]|uniref:Uncharacterized protein n=1 Tax=Aristolochia fimbriata TaxID=158543 RepID=A0AAV7DXH9_ARIFI|nr:hypothetical protein H6P81_020461 [Aristolochia fimbriata]
MKATLVFIPAPGRGHLAVTVELAKLINQGNRFSITILTIASPIPGVPALSDSYSATGALDINFVDLPTVDPPEKPTPVAFISRYIASHAPHVKNALLRLKSTSTRVAALVVDFFASTMIEVGDELGIPSYVFATNSVNMVGFILYFPTLDAKVESDFEDLEEEEDIEIPGLGPLPPPVLPPPLQKKSSEGYKWFLELTRRFGYAKGIIVNTFRELEPAALEAVSGGRCLPDHPTPPIFPVGPVLVLEERDPSHPCIAWLDGQPPGSVVFLCFGSMGTLPELQVRRLYRRSDGGRSGGGPARGFRGANEGPRPCLAAVGAADGDPVPRGDRGVRVPLRVEFDLGEPLVRGAHSPVADPGGAADERVGAGEGHRGRRRADQDGLLPGAVLGRSGGGGERREETDGGYRRREESEREGHGSQSRRPRRRRGRRLVVGFFDAAHRTSSL